MTSFEWKIKNIRMAPLLPGTSVQSPPFYIEESKTFEFCLKLLPRHFDLNLFLWRCDKTSKSVMLQYRLVIQSGVKRNASTHRNEFRLPADESSCWEDKKFLSISRFECEDIVNISCEIMWHNNFEDIDEGDLKDLSCAYASLLDTGLFSDVRFIIGGKVFNVHRAILEARSPSLLKVLEKKDFEKEYSRICRDKAVFQKTFQYLYSGKIDDQYDLNDSIYDLFEKTDKSIFKRMSNSHAFFSSVETLFQMKRYHFEWSIEDFVKVISSRKLYYNITEGNPWCWMKIIMFLDPNKRDNVKFIIRRLDCSINMSILCKIDVKGCSSNLLEGSLSGHVFHNEVVWEVPENFQMEQLNEYLHNGILKLVVDINIGNGRYCSNFTDTRFLNITSNINHMYYLREDLKKLFECPTFYDVSLKAGDRVFQAHKAILSARSPVFHDMFRNDKSKVQNGEVIINDIRSDVLLTMLLYIYCGQLKNLDLTLNFAINLYYAASKYQIHKLKLRCSVFLQTVLSVDNAGMLLILADTHGDDNLKTVVLDFVCSDVNRVLQSAEWKDTITSRPDLLYEILRRTCRVDSD